MRVIFFAFEDGIASIFVLIPRGSLFFILNVEIPTFFDPLRVSFLFPLKEEMLAMFWSPEALFFCPWRTKCSQLFLIPGGSLCVCLCRGKCSKFSLIPRGQLFSLEEKCLHFCWSPEGLMFWPLEVDIFAIWLIPRGSLFLPLTREMLAIRLITRGSLIFAFKGGNASIFVLLIHRGRLFLQFEWREY